MLLLSLPSATVLGLIVAFIHPVVGDDNQVNYYSDQNCQYYQGTWPGPESSTYSISYPVTVGYQSVGSVIVLPGKKSKFNLFTVNTADQQTTYILINDLRDTCKGAMPIANPVPNYGEDTENYCYTINDNVTNILFSTLPCS
jgi:hypothetical protein